MSSEQTQNLKMANTTMESLDIEKALELPEDIVEHIISFACYSIYNSIDYYKNKKKSYNKIIRINTEIEYYKSLRVSPCWLRGTREMKQNGGKKFKNSLKNSNPKTTYHTGCYRDCRDELRHLSKKLKLK